MNREDHMTMAELAESYITLDELLEIADTETVSEDGAIFSMIKSKQKNRRYYLLKFCPRNSRSMRSPTNSKFIFRPVQSCWLVIPPTKTIVLFNDIHHPNSYSTGQFTDPTIGVDVSVEDIFS
ncbi:hypothetical protein QUF80_18365 [Desulfococcaceae bacterium HSG8]|nr:hypothetical protein [Desulfococcaceae bacterium HSG8]